MSQNKNHRLVYSTDGSHKDICKTCGELACLCRKPELVSPNQTLLKVRLESKGRGGKSVSVIFNLPHNPDYFSKMTKKLKSSLGCGGTYKKEGQIEIQGDHRQKIKAWLEKEGFKVKLAGG